MSAGVWVRPRLASARGENDCAPSDSRVAPRARHASRRARSSVAGFASTVTSSGRKSNAARMSADRTAISSGSSRLGVPPPKNAVAISGWPRAAPSRASSPPRAARYRPRNAVVAGAVAKSQYGHRDAQNGMWTYSEVI